MTDNSIEAQCGRILTKLATVKQPIQIIRQLVLLFLAYVGPFLRRSPDLCAAMNAVYR